MSTDVPSRSSSPVAESVAESTADESFIIRLKDIKTIAQLYQSGVLKAVVPEKHLWNPKPDFLERVSL
jgi:hypothetical protein